MITLDLMRKAEMTPAKLKLKFTAKKQKDEITELINLTRDRIEEGRRQNLADFRLFWALDLAYDVPFRQETATMIVPFLEKVARQDMSSKEVLEQAQEYGLTHMVREYKDENGKTCCAVDAPVFFKICIPLVRAYHHIRWAKLFNDRNVFPLLKFEPLVATLANRTKCEILTSAIEMMGQQMGYRSVLKQWLHNMLHYGTAVMFPAEDWFRDRSVRLTPEGKMEKYVARQGLRYNIPHPTRVFYDQTHRIGTINSDSGIDFAGYWRIARYRDVRANNSYFNTDKVSMMQNDLIRSNSTFFANVYPCTMEFPEYTAKGTAPRSGAGSLDRESQATYYTASHDDKAVVLTDIYQKLVPERWGLADVDVPIWFRMVVANDTDIIYIAPVGYTPILYLGYDAHEERRRNASLSLEVLPFQDHMSNLLTQQILTAKQNLMRVSFVNSDLVPQKYLDAIQNLGEDLYRTVNFVPYSGRKTTMQQADIRQAFTSVTFPQGNTVELMSAFRLLLDTLERVLVFSAQEVGAVASHEQTAEETRVIQGSVNNRVALTDSFVEDAIYAWKKQLYDALMAYGDAEVWAQVPAEPPMTVERINSVGFEIAEAGVPNHGTIKVKGPKSKLEMEGFVSGREGESRINNPEIATAMSQFMQVMMSNPITATAIGPQQALEVFNTIARIAGLPRDFKLHVANQQLIDQMQQGQAQQDQGAQQQQMAEAFKKMAEELLNRSGEQSAQIVDDAVKPLLDEHKQLIEAIGENKQDIKAVENAVDTLMTRLQVLMQAASKNAGGSSGA